MTIKEIDDEIARLQKLKEEIYSRKIAEMQKNIGEYFACKTANMFGKIHGINERVPWYNCNSIYYYDNEFMVESEEGHYPDDIEIISKEEFDRRFSKAVEALRQFVEDNYIDDGDEDI